MYPHLVCFMCFLSLISAEVLGVDKFNQPSFSINYSVFLLDLSKYFKIKRMMSLFPTFLLYRSSCHSSALMTLNISYFIKYHNESLLNIIMKAKTCNLNCLHLDKWKDCMIFINDAD